MVVSAVLVACDGEPSPPTTSDGNGTTTRAGLIEGEVVDVEDGDTFVLETAVGALTVRLLGVNAPERDECLHDEAAAGLGIKLEEGALAVEDHGHDQFGRTLGYVWAGASFVNLALVDSGLAIATTPGENETRGNDLLAAEEAAYRARTGIWDPAACNGSARDFELAIDTSGHDPPGPDDEVLDFERVTIFNRGDSVADLSGWILRDESSSHRFRFPHRSVIEPGGTLGVTSADLGWEPGGSPVWNNDGDIALLLTPNGAVAARERYQP